MNLVIRALILWHIQIYSTQTYPRIIWSYWDGKFTNFMNDIHNQTVACLDERWDYRLLNKSTLGTYLNISTFPLLYFSLYPQIQSDYIRLRLLKEYGGWWLDVPTLINSNTLLENFYSEALKRKVQLLGFSNHFYHGHPYLETGIMYAPNGSNIISLWLQEMEVLFSIGIIPYMHYVGQLGVYLPPPVYQPYPFLDGYFAVYSCSALVMERLIPRNTTFITYDVNQYYYKMIDSCNWSGKCIQKVMRSSKQKEYPIIKLNWPARKVLDPEYRQAFPLIHQSSYERKPDAWLFAYMCYHLLCYACVSLHMIQMVSIGIKLPWKEKDF